MNIILDLDNTILCSIEMDKLKKMSKKTLQRLEEFEYVDMGKLFRVFLRPGVQEFLTYIFKHYNVSVWTAASKDYALFIIDKIILHPDLADIKNRKDEKLNIGNRKLDFIFFDYHGDISDDLNDHPKYLKMLWSYYKFPGYTKDNTYIIDDNRHVHSKQHDNVIKAVYFDVEKKDSNSDTFLKDVIKELEGKGKKCKEVCE